MTEIQLVGGRLLVVLVGGGGGGAEFAAAPAGLIRTTTSDRYLWIEPVAQSRLKPRSPPITKLPQNQGSIPAASAKYPSWNPAFMQRICTSVLLFSTWTLPGVVTIHMPLTF